MIFRKGLTRAVTGGLQELSAEFKGFRSETREWRDRLETDVHELRRDLDGFRRETRQEFELVGAKLDVLSAGYSCHEAEIKALKRRQAKEG